MITNDRKIVISYGNSRKSINWQRQELMLSEMWDRLRNPVRGAESLNDYMRLSRAEQDALKDVGGYVGGALGGPRRKSTAVLGRDLITLDLDNIPASSTDTVLRRAAGLGVGYCTYSTRKHHPAAPRLRVIVPLDRTASADEYEPIARKVAEHLGLELADPTTFEASRMMYWPSCSSDSDYVYLYEDKPFASVDGLLAQYADWRDVTTWPALPGAPAMVRMATKQGDPESKAGVVGAFCGVYDVPRAIEELIPNIYAPTDNESGRYTFTGGSTAGGAVLYDHGKFLYSHHATDPCGGKLVNAFDMVRLHRFADLDDEAPSGTPINRMPSYEAMRASAAEIPEVVAIINRERMAQTAASDFAGVGASAPGQTDAEDDTGWLMKLAINSQTALPKATIDNVLLILEHDPKLKNRFAYSRLERQRSVWAALPWNADSRPRLWSDTDKKGAQWYMEHRYSITGEGKIDAALALYADRHAFDAVPDYLRTLSWDGAPRLDALFVDYLGAEDSEYTRAITRKSFVAAVARAMTPGCKFDTMMILSGAQGLGKSTLLDTMSRGWFNDSIRTFEGKDASELLPGVWIVEISELDAFRRTDVARIKQFLSLRADRYRATYGEFVQTIPRACVFFGTTNTRDFLQDTTGNRRFWPLNVGEQPASKSVWDDLPLEVDQIWAEAMAQWSQGEPLHLSKEQEPAAREKQEEHREPSPHEGIVLEFLAREVPIDWADWDLNARRAYWGNSVVDAVPTAPRQTICVQELWAELFDGARKDLSNAFARVLNQIVDASPNWKRLPKRAQFGKPYGQQRGHARSGVSAD